MADPTRPEPLPSPPEPPVASPESRVFALRAPGPREPGSRSPGSRGAGPSLRLRLRRAHAALAPWVMAPLLLTVSTGLGYRLLRDWGGFDRDQAHGLMVLHEGQWLQRWFGVGGETVYVLANGLGLLWMLGSGAAMVWERWRRSAGGAEGRADT